jgi:hypothetical protein
LRLADHAVRLTDLDQQTADEYLFYSTQASQAEKHKANAKKHLLMRLGDKAIGILPDGRSVRKITREFAAEAEPRKAHTSVSLAID